MNAAASILAHSGRLGSKAAIVTASQTRTFAALEERTGRIAAGLTRLGLAPGESVAVMLPSGSDSIEASLAVLRGGFVHVGVNVMFKAAELEQLLADSSARAIVVDGDRARRLVELRDRLPLLTTVIVAGEGPGDVALDELASAPTAPPADLPPEADAAIIYTGGTTGAPKGALHDQANIARQIETMVEYYRLTEADSGLGCLPTFLMPPLLAGHLSVLGAGGTLHLMERFDAADALALLAAERISFCAGTKTMCWMFNELPSEADEDLGFMRVFSFGGMYQPRAVREEFEQRFNRPTLHVYGMSEGPNLVCGTPLDLPEAVRREKLDSVGLPLAGIEIAALDREGRPVVGESGEICLRPDGTGRWQPFRGYRGRPDATAAALRDGWYHSGDAGHLDEDGFVHVLGRTEELIKVSGWSVFPGEIEAVIAEHPGVEEVAVIGVPDAKAGERPVAFAKARAGAELQPRELEALVGDRLASFKRLHAAEVVDELPKNLYGKVQKNRLRQAYGERAEEGAR